MSGSNRRNARPSPNRGPLALALVLALGTSGCRDEPAPRLLQPEDELASSALWENLYEAAEDHPRLAQAKEIFARVSDAAGVHAELRVLTIGRLSRALALPDGTIVLSTAGLDLCFEGVDEAEGVVQLAYLLAHELDHINKRDFWHASAFAALREIDDEEEATRRLRELLRQDEKDRRVVETRADQAGILTVLAAGYDATHLVDEGQRFFERWMETADDLADEDVTHPDAATRAQSLLSILRYTLSQSPLFEQAVEQLQAVKAIVEDGDPARQDEIETTLRGAIESLRTFRGFFEGREVMNNLAVAHLRLASIHLARCDGGLVVRYYLPDFLDPVTLARRTTLRGAEAGPHCPDAEDHLDLAIDLLRIATERDPSYRPAHQNMVAALLLAGRGGPIAVDHAEKLRRLASDDDPEALLALPLAMLAWAENGARMVDVDAAFAELEDLYRRFPDDPVIAFDRAAALTRHGSWNEAQAAWRTFLDLEPDGIWARIARDQVDPEVSRGP